MISHFYAEEDAPAIPLVFELAHNYPNPFNPTTTIEYQVPAPGANVHIRIYNVRGQMVRTLVNERKAPGSYSSTWDGVNNAGSRVATGVYFLRMTAGQFVKTRKLVILE